ncbi:MAG: cation transporter [Clostridiales bacterium]|nr:cation transporter [Clostridiales bacterium]
MTEKGRNKSAVITLIIGLALNLALGGAKLAAGIISDSVSVMSDAFNNLSDAGVSMVTIVAVWLSARAADHDHPYGHGRYEYIATFILGAVIAMVGVEVCISGVQRIITPVDVEFGAVVWAALGASVGIKAFMAVFYAVRGKKVGSDTIKAAAVDSASDCVVTAVVLACAVAEMFTGAHIDGYASIAVAIFVLVFAVRILKNTVNRLLGTRPSQNLIESVKMLILSEQAVVSLHDLIINDYGEKSKLAEVDVVFPAKMSFVEVHAVCDRIESAARDTLGVKLCIHADPFITDDERLNELRTRIDALLKPFGASAHDIGIDDCKKRVALDVLISGDGQPVDEIAGLINAESETLLGYGADVNVDYI